MLPADVSPARRVAQVAASILFCFTIAGLVFGFAALKPILIDQGVYGDLCADGLGCKAQDTRLNILFIIATSATNVAALPLGSFLDRVGPKVSSISGGLVFLAGCIIFGIGHVSKGYFLLAVGAPAMFLAQFHLSNAFPARSGLILGAITGAFDASSMPFVFYKLAYFAYGGFPSLRSFFFFYAVIPVLLIIQQLTFGPSSVYVREADDAPEVEPAPVLTDPFAPAHPALAESPLDSGISRRSAHTRPGAAARRGSHRPPAPARTRRMSSAFSRVSYGLADGADDDEVVAKLDKGDGIVGVLFGMSVREQIASSWFWTMQIMILVHMTRINWYLATVNAQLVYYTGDVVLADKLTDAFIFLLPVGGLLAIPLVGYLLDARPTRDVVGTMFTLGLAFGALTLVRSTGCQLAGIGALVVFRPLFYTAISDYAAKVFGFTTFGTVYGLSMTLSGLFGLVLGPLDAAVKGPLAGDYTPVNAALLSAGALACASMGWRVVRRRIRLEEGAIREEEEG
ncbi:hypothetical protein Q5752_005699 [Cryptotrichosporon argae]